MSSTAAPHSHAHGHADAMGIPRCKLLGTRVGRVAAEAIVTAILRHAECVDRHRRWKSMDVYRGPAGFCVPLGVTPDRASQGHDGGDGGPVDESGADRSGLGHLPCSRPMRALADSGAKPFGHMARAARQSRGMGLREVARRIGVSASYVSGIERAKFTPPAEIAFALAVEYGWTMAELLQAAGVDRRDAVIGWYVRNHATDAVRDALFRDMNELGVLA